MIVRWLPYISAKTRLSIIRAVSLRLFLMRVKSFFYYYYSGEMGKGGGGGGDIWRLSFNCPCKPFLSRALISTLIKKG